MRIGGEILKKLIVFVTAILLLAGCTSNTHTYRHISDEWKIALTVKQNASATNDYLLEIKYIGDTLDLATEPDITYTLVTPQMTYDNTKALSVVGTIKEDGLFTCTSCDILQEQDDVTFTIEWDGKKETFPLSTNQQ